MCLHTFPPWNKINNEKKNSTNFFKIKHCLFILWMGEFSPFNIGSVGIPQWLEHQIRDRKVPSSSPRRSGFFFFFFSWVWESILVDFWVCSRRLTRAHAHTESDWQTLTYAHPRTKTRINTLMCAGTCTHTQTHVLPIRAQTRNCGF